MVIPLIATVLVTFCDKADVVPILSITQRGLKDVISTLHVYEI